MYLIYKEKIAMEETAKYKARTIEDIEVRKPIRIIDTGSDKTNLEIKETLRDFEVRFLENVKIQYFGLTFSDKLDFCRKMMSIYALIVNLHHRTNYLKQRSADVLAFYMAMGYSQETKDIIMEVLEINIKNLNQVNYELTRKMFLVRDPYNSQKRSLSIELQQLRDSLLDNEGNSTSLNIRFKKKVDESRQMKVVD